MRVLCVFETSTYYHYGPKCRHRILAHDEIQKFYRQQQKMADELAAREENP